MDCGPLDEEETERGLQEGGDDVDDGGDGEERVKLAGSRVLNNLNQPILQFFTRSFSIPGCSAQIVTIDSQYYLSLIGAIPSM